MVFSEQTTRLTHTGVMAMLSAAVEKAEEIGVPQCIVIVDASGVTLGSLRMNGSRYLALRSATTKACTSASIGAPSANIPEPIRDLIGAATQNSMTSLPGGLPIMIGGVLAGGIGIGSGTGDQDLAVANAALDAIGAQTFA